MSAARKEARESAKMPLLKHGLRAHIEEILIAINRRKNTIEATSYGKTMALCDNAKGIMDQIIDMTKAGQIETTFDG